MSTKLFLLTSAALDAEYPKILPILTSRVTKATPFLCHVFIFVLKCHVYIKGCREFILQTTSLYQLNENPWKCSNVGAKVINKSWLLQSPPQPFSSSQNEMAMERGWNEMNM